MDAVALLSSLSQVPSCIKSHIRGSSVQNAKVRLPYLFIGVLGASLVYSLSKPCGSLVGYKLEHKTCEILAAERLRLMRFDNRLIIDSFQEDICIIDEREVVWRGL